MIKYILFFLAILNLLAGCFAGILLVETTGNYAYYLINAISGGFSGGVVAYVGVIEGERT